MVAGVISARRGRGRSLVSCVEPSTSTPTIKVAAAVANAAARVLISELGAKLDRRFLGQREPAGHREEFPARSRRKVYTDLGGGPAAGDVAPSPEMTDRAALTQRARLALPPGERDHARGPATAPVTLVEYGDYECPYCRAAVPIVAELQRLLGEQLRYVFRHFPLTNVHPHAQLAAEAAEAAAAQGKFFEMHGMLFENHDALEEDDLERYAGELGLDRARFRRELEGGAYTQRVQEDFQNGLDSGVRGTPTFFLDEVRYDWVVGVRQLLATIREAHPDVVDEGFEGRLKHQRLIPRVVGERSRLDRSQH
jgi:protein-disulfide isomerase